MTEPGLQAVAVTSVGFAKNIPINQCATVTAPNSEEAIEWHQGTRDPGARALAARRRAADIPLVCSKGRNPTGTDGPRSKRNTFEEILSLA